MNTYKQSIYNQIIEYKEEYLIYNSLSGAFICDEQRRKEADGYINI